MAPNYYQMKTYLLLAALLASTFLPAQEALLFEDTQEETLVYRYHHLSGPSAGALQQIIRCLAPNQLHEPAFDLFYAYQLQILEKEEALKICINWEEITVDRELRPAGFPFADILKPSGATFNLQLLADGEVVKSECIQQTFGNTLPGHSYNFANFEGGVYYTLRVTDLHFNYGSTQVQAVRNRKQAIDEYLAAKDKLVQLHDFMEQLRQSEVQPQHINEYQIQLKNYRQQVQAIRQASFWNVLNLRGPNAHDPEDLVQHLRACQNDIQNLQAWLDELAANLHVLYHEQGIELFQAGQRQAARDAFCAALRTNDCYAPSHCFIAYLDFEAGQVEASGQRIVKVLNQYNPDPATRTDARRLANGIVRFYLDAGQEAVSLRQYPDGVALYETALSFSESIRGFDFGQAEAVSRIKEAYYMDFHDQIDQVMYTRQSGQYALALQQLEQAMAFQQRFRVESHVDTRRLMAQIVDALYEEQLADIRQLRRDQSWDQALTKIKESEQLLANYPGLVQHPLALDSEKRQVLSGKFQTMLAKTEQLVNDRRLDQALQQAQATDRFTREYDLEDSMKRESKRQITRIQQLRYERFVRGGDRAQSQGHFAQALEQYDQAQRLSTNINDIRPDQGLPARITQAAVARATQMYEQTMASASTDNTQIHQTIDGIRQLAGRYQISNQPEVQQLFAQLEDQRCVNARSILLPSEELKLEQQQQDRDYIAARATTQRIEALLSEYTSCGLSSSSLLMSKAIVEACAHYQENLRAAETAEQQQQFGRAIEYYQVAKVAYQDASVQARLAGHPAFRLQQYVEQHPSYHMQLAGAHYYLDQREHQTALGLLNLIVERGTPPRATEGLQQRLGSALAVRHYADAAKWKPTFYTFVDKSERKTYKTMYRSFRKQWKRMV